jgi:two-component system sensor histidine kinase/response regulator
LRLLHTLKGLAATLGADSLSSEAGHCERQLAANPSPVHAMKIAREAAAAIAAVLPGLTALAGALAAAAAAAAPAAAVAASPADPIDTEVVVTDLRALIVQLQRADMAATDAFEALLQKADPLLSRHLQPIGEAISALDFAGALTVCTALIGEIAAGEPA